MKEIGVFEKEMLESCGVKMEGRLNFLFYTKDVKSAFKMKSLTQDIYASLVRWSKENFSGLKSMDPDKQIAKFRAFFHKPANEEKNLNLHNIYVMQKEGF